MSLGWATLRQPIHRRVPVRWSTVLMALAFIGLGALYLDVRTETPTKVVVGVSTATTSAPHTTTTEPATTTIAPTETQQAPTGSSTTQATAASGSTTTSATSSTTTVTPQSSSPTSSP
jgi:hypothetical protein